MAATVSVSGHNLDTAKTSTLDPLMHNVSKWSNTLQKSCSICCKIFKVCLTILEQYALKG